MRPADEYQAPSPICIAVHSHRIIAADKALATARAEVTLARTAARQAGVPMKALAGALKALRRGGRTGLTEAEQMIVHAVESVALGDVSVHAGAGAFSHSHSPQTIAPDATSLAGR